MLTREFKILLIISLSRFCGTSGEEQLETFCNVNGKKALQYVSEKFLSISIDPAVLIAGLNLSDTSLQLAQHLGPAYIRIAGPSTKFVKYVDNEDKFDDRLSDDGNNVVVTPSMWFGINEWLSLANLTPVFGINDAETTRGVWNPKSTLPLLEISDKLNVSCYWQLGFDSSQKDELQYKQDLSIFAHLLAAFPERNESWKLVGSDISHIQQDHMENVMMELQDITTAVMWEPMGVTEDSFPEKDMGWKILNQQHKPPIKLWTTVPRAEEPVSFSSAMLWATQIGKAARVGYDVVFRQPRLHEMFSDTPAYWFSLLHKKLMGGNVLDARTTVNHPGSSVYAHCTRKQNSFARRGAITVMIVNSNLDDYKVKVKLGTPSNEKTLEVLSYILTTTAANSTDIFLNGEKLTPDLLLEKNPFEPKLRRAKLKSHILLEVPPMSIAFFVLPGARVPVCINEENEMDLLLEEIAEDQNLPLSEELVLKLSSRSSFVNNPTLEEIAQRMKKEMQSDEKFYNADHSLNFKLNALRQRMQDEPPEEKEVNQKSRKFFIEKAERQKKHMDMERRREEFKKILSEKAKTSDSYKHEPKIVSKSKHLDLTSEEVEKILKDRARARAAQRNIIFTDEELDALIHKATKQFSKKYKRSVPTLNRCKRDINTHLLDRTINFEPTSSKHSVEDKQSIDSEEFSKNKRKVRKPRDLNMKRLDYKAKLEDGRQRMEDRRYEILGNAKNMKNSIKDKLRKLKYVKRLKRDINMDLIKIKSDGQRMKPQKEAYRKQPKSFFKDKDVKEATIRKPGQTSAELLEELEQEDKSREEVKPTKLEIFAELADPEEDEEDDFFKTNIKYGGSFFDDASRRKEVKRGKQGRQKDSNEVQFLTASEEFSDIEEDLPCIHEFFGPRRTDDDNTKGTNIIQELGEIEIMARKGTNKESEKRKMAELGDVEASEQDSMELYRNKRAAEKSTEENEDFDVKCQTKHSGPGCRTQLSTNTLSDEDDHLLDDPMLENVMPPENEMNEHKTTELARSMLSDDKPVKDLSHIQEEHQTSDADLQLLEGGSENKDIRRNPAKPTDLMPHEVREKAMDCSVLEALESTGDIQQELADYYMEKCLPCSEKSRSSEHKRDYPLQNSESGGLKTPLRKSKKRRSLKCSKIDGNEFGQLRKKRDLDQETKSTEKLSSTKNEERHELKELQQKIMKDKLKYEEEKTKNKLQLLQIKKQQEQECMENERDDILEEIHNTNIENQNAIQEQLQSLKKKLEQRKKEIDKLLFRDTPNLTMRNFEPKTNVREALTDDMEVVEHKHEETPPPVQMAKRSLINQKGEVFGNYKPLTKNLKTWKPSDILSLKRDVSYLKSPRLKPISDYRIAKNGHFNLRRKRSIDIDVSDRENEIDGFMNEIEKDDRYIRPKMSAEKRDYALSIPGIDTIRGKHDSSQGENESKADTSEGKTLKMVEDSRSVITEHSMHKKADSTADPIIVYTFSDDFGQDIGSDLDTVDSAESFSFTVSNIQKVPDKSEQQAFDKFLDNITGFMTNIGRQLGLYLRHMANN